MLNGFIKPCFNHIPFRTMSSGHNLKKTPLYEFHKQCEGKLIDFGGWKLPVQFTQIRDEHRLVRKSVGIFDVSHMGNIFIKGKDSAKFLNYMTTNQICNLTDRTSQYTAMCLPTGGILDDLLVYRLKENNYMLCVNASNTEKVDQWLNDHKIDYNISLENLSDEYSQIAIQGPGRKSI